jgi:hypothetical protein
MNIKTLKKLNCTIYAPQLHNLCRKVAQFVQIFTLFFSKFQTYILYFNNLVNEKLFFSCTNYATIYPIYADNQPNSTCTISSIICTNYSTISLNYHIFNKLIHAIIAHPHKYLKIKNLHKRIKRPLIYNAYKPCTINFVLRNLIFNINLTFVSSSNK